ncbi:molybdenum cofactor biosynthesis protein MoaE [Ralstonia insidiosa]|uniref:molybdenum cofactor biosynthesis protein MoaE n=1 Tax=Ralstonia insidiosa TaxID=190721 RepID=UPI0009ED3449|nr:molybdenum cofactor biosynthesis protein MoaE [Ralstonia insidiosa]KAB0467358.1 molybdenum cofactor biosynthesis protein MoaE [Ralstonia insidiosa]MBY4909466.1 molybdenum cofactor biosynthesis protein MoaE [Ralstonia insidiosa]
MTPASDHPPAQSDVQASTDTPDIENTAFQPEGRQLNIAAGFEVRLQRVPIDIQAELEPIMRNPKVGAVVNFVGVVRQSGDLDDVIALELEHYPGMTEQTLWTLIEEAAARWQVEAVKIVHRVGRIALGNPVVLVAVAAPHRASAFDACEFLMDFLKTHAPFWKKEIQRSGASEWVETKISDEQAMKRWG